MSIFFLSNHFISVIFLILLLDIALLNHDEEAYELLSSLESFMNNQIVESELISISSNESGEKDVENATQAFLDAALTGDLKLLTSLYLSGTKVLHLNYPIFSLRIEGFFIFPHFVFIVLSSK